MPYPDFVYMWWDRWISEPRLKCPLLKCLKQSMVIQSSSWFKSTPGNNNEKCDTIWPGLTRYIFGYFPRVNAQLHRSVNSDPDVYPAIFCDEMFSRNHYVRTGWGGRGRLGVNSGCRYRRELELRSLLGTHCDVMYVQQGGAASADGGAIADHSDPSVDVELSVWPLRGASGAVSRAQCRAFCLVCRCTLRS